jgi:FMN phosphatase YigB (HAD superfamily)
MRLGLDFDNTLICYDQLFHRVALDKGLIPAAIPKQKNAVRDSMREKGIEEDWTRLQGEVYGSRILEAEPYPGMLATLKQLSSMHIPMCIVSHKTRTPYLGEPWDLHAAARGWLQRQGFLDAKGLAWAEDQIFFELTKQEKVARILALGCTHYVDDLPEILAMLPAHVERILFAPSQDVQSHPDWKRISSWQELPSILGLQ